MLTLESDRGELGSLGGMNQGRETGRLSRWNIVQQTKMGQQIEYTVLYGREGTRFNRHGQFKVKGKRVDLLPDSRYI